MALIDDRISHRQDCILGAAKGNLAYQKFIFLVYPKFALDLKSANLNKALSFIHHFERSDLMIPGDKPFAITYRIGYALNNSHHSIVYKKEEYIELEDVLSEIGHVKDKQFCDIDPQDRSWALNFRRKLPPRISSDSLYIGKTSKSLEPTPRDILKSTRNMSSKVDNINQTISQLSEDNYKDEELIINGSNVSILDQALKLLDLAESKGKDKVNLEISTSEELKQLFHFDETINVIEETFDKETFVYISEEEVESLSSDIEPNFGMNKIEPQFEHHGESYFQGERRKRPKTEQGHRTGSMPNLPTGNPNQFGTNVLNIDNIETDRKEFIDIWTSEISLIIQTNKEKYATKKSILLLFNHKTS
ncbi:unnamed protein product [Lactuca virosa]|uniref:Uncharacterized protein n=1 Tax=Lactuca virosa TaxID=75947 RepID=A0AAU9M850_9ASTR|nr:unnamed protein product [Lactuca virosa]